ncbi:MAG: TatD family hydrolase [Lentisphaeria bacterium]
MTPLIETHYHPNHVDVQQAASELELAKAEDVQAFIAVGTDLESSRQLAQFAGANDDVWSTVGCHPHEAANFDGDLERFRELATASKVCAIGEIGLDYYYEHSDRQAQKQVFDRFLRLAAELDLPAVVHCRDAYEDCLEILERDLQPRQSLEIHSFTGPAKFIGEFLDLGAYISFNGIVTFKKAENVREALDAVPLDRLLLETDAPYLAPVPHRGHPNQPAYLPHIAETIAKRKGVETAEVAERTTGNAREFFKILQNFASAV